MKSFRISNFAFEDIEYVLKNDIFNQIKDEKYIALADLLWKHYGHRMKSGFGARSHHHNYEGGLLDHSLEVTMMALKCAEVFPNAQLNLDELIIGAFFHDIGKLDCYECEGEGYEIKKTSADSLIGHFGIGLMVLSRVMDKSDLTDKEKDSLCHILVAHHGPVSNGWGSLVDPVTPEAQIVHYVDLISSRVGGD